MSGIHSGPKACLGTSGYFSPALDPKDTKTLGDHEAACEPMTCCHASGSIFPLSGAKLPHLCVRIPWQLCGLIAMTSYLATFTTDVRSICKFYDSIPHFSQKTIINSRCEDYFRGLLHQMSKPFRIHYHFTYRLLAKISTFHGMSH